MNTKAAFINSNHKLVLAFVAAVLAFVFSTYASAATAKKVSSKAPVIKSKKTQAAKKSASSVMFVNLKQRRLIAQNAAAQAADAKLEGEFMKDSIPIAVPAQASLATSVMAKPEAANTWDFGTAFSVETSTGVNSAEKKSYSGEYVLVPSIAHNPTKTSAAAKIAYGREYTEEKEDNTDGDLSSISIVLRKAVEVGGLVDGIHFGPNFVIPAGNEARRQTLNGAIGATIGATKKLGKFSAKQEFSYSYRFYRFDIRDNGTINSPHSFSSSTSAGLEITKWFGVSAEFIAQQLINFRGTPTGNTSAAVAGDFTISEKVSASLGLATSLAGTLSDDGQSRRVLLYDPGVTAIFLSLGLSI